MGASLEMRAGRPTMYSSATISPSTSTVRSEKRRIQDSGVELIGCTAGTVTCAHALFLPQPPDDLVGREIDRENRGDLCRKRSVEDIDRSSAVLYNAGPVPAGCGDGEGG